MNGAALLIVLLSHQGYWVSAQDQSITVRWAAKEPMPAADLVWELGLGQLKLDGGSVAMNADPGAVVNIKAPNVRVRRTLRWTYQLIQRDSKKLLEAGELPIFDFPPDMTQNWPRRILNDGSDSRGVKKLVVWDDDNGLPKVLADAKVPFTRVGDLTKVFDRPDMVLIGPDQIDGSPFSAGPLVSLARGGASIAVFQQTRPEWIAGYAIARRSLLRGIRFKSDHPLFENLSNDDLQSWTTGEANARWALQLPPDEPALALAWWPAEGPEDPVRPIDALMVTRTIGMGRIVLCQLPLGSWRDDPRSQILLGNMLSYLATRPQPTPPPSQRHDAPPAPKPISTILIPNGVNP